MSTGESTAQAPLNMDHYQAVRKALLKVRPQWRNIGLELGITPYKLNEFSGSLEDKMDQMVEVWLNHTYSTPTWGALVTALRDVTVEGGKPVATEIEANYIGGGQSVAVNPSLAAKRTEKGTLDSYADYLRGRYSTELPAFFTLQWPPPPTRKVFNLAMIGRQTIQRSPIDEELVRLTLRGGVDDIMRRKTSIELKNLFKLDDIKRKIILIEGAPGAGKSTLAWHIIQKWESGELFQEFRVVVFVQLRDPTIQAAKSLADLLPARSSNMRVELQSNMEACDGRGVLFVLDGWDEYGPGLQHSSLFQQLICTPGEVNMHFSSLVITSRPIASGELQRYASSRVEIVGFSSAEVKKYFNECIGESEQELKSESETVQKFQDHLRERPVIEASCYLPLNAAIIVHLYLSLSHTLPHTLHEVFLSLVCCCITRHLTKEAEEGENSPDILSLDDLPPDVLKLFNNICIMAYHGVMKNKATFSAADLRSFNLPTKLNTLSLIQGVQNLAAKHFNISFNFLHLSVQELLTAFHVSKLSAPEQIQIFNDLFDQPRLAAVFRFYAAFTKLQTEGVRDIVARIVQKQEKPLLVNLLHGLYEAQDPSLCEFVASHLKRELDLSENTLSPMDCLVVGYFLSCVCLTTSGEFKVYLSSCSLDDYRASFLIREMAKQLSTCSNLTDAQTTTCDGAPGCLAMDLRKNQLSGRCIDSLLHILNVVSSMYLSDPIRNVSFKTNRPLKRLSARNCGISEKGGKAIGDALMVNRSLQVLDLHGNPISAGVVHIAESLKCNHSLLEINLSNCGISEKGGKAIGDALMVNRSLQVLDLHGNPISVGVVHIAESLKCNHSLLEINLSNCGISEKGGKAIGDALMVNRSLQVLDLHGNPISAGVVHIAESLKRNHSLIELNLGNCGTSEEGFKAVCEALMVGRRSLQVLDLHENSIEEKRCKAIGDALVVDMSVEVLDECHNPISAGAIHVAGSLKHNHSLLKLNLRNCDISEKGGKAIGDALMVNRSLQVLDLHGNPISAGVVHIAESLKHNHSLQEINLSNCNISEKGGKAIGDALMVNRSLQVLDLQGNPISAGVVHIAESLNCNHSLREINLSDCRISEEGGKAIGDALMVNRSLQVLDLHDNPISTGMVHIAESLKHNHSLLEINLGRCRISEEGGKAIGDALMVNRSLQVLKLCGNPISVGVVHIAESLKRNHSLLEINLGNCGITEKGGKGTGDALMVNRSLQVLNLCDNPISTGVVHIAESLKHNHSLLEINLRRCRISQEGGKAIGDALMVNRSLQVLDLHGNPISAGVVHIAESLKCNHSLLEINLGVCGITEREAESLAISLKENNSLHTLNLRGNSLSDGGGAHIADGLRHNNCLKRLDISQCGIGDRGVVSIGSALEVNNSLEELDLSENHSVRLMALGESLKRNKGVKTLRLLGLYPSDWKQFIVCLQENTHLTELQLPSSMQRQEMITLNDIRRTKNLPPLRFNWISEIHVAI